MIKLGRKDHLITAVEQSRESQRDMRKAIQTVYLGNPPTLTRNLQEAGAAQKTAFEVRDTAQPILASIDDLTDNIQTETTATTKTITVFLDKEDAAFHRLLLDDDTGTITDFVINFKGLAKNKAMEFMMDIETFFLGTPNVIFDPPIIGLPTAFGSTGNDEVKLKISAINTPVTESYEVIGGGSGGGLTEPVILTPNFITQQTAPTKTIIDWNKNINVLTMSANTDFDFSNLPANGMYEGIQIIIDIDSTGGYDTPTWPVSLLNPPIVPTTPDTRFSVMLYTIDGGLLVTHGTSVGSSATGGIANLSELTIDVSKDWQKFAITNLSATAYVDTGGVSRGSISGDAGATAIRLSLSTANKFIISDVLTDIVSFDDATGIKLEGTHVINANNNIINQIGELQLSNFSSHTPSNENTIAFDSIDDELKYSVALTTDAHSWYADTDRLASIVRTGTDQGQLNIHDIITDNLSVNNQFIMFDSALDPGFNGEFRRNGIDVKVFTGNSLLNLSNIGVQNSIVDGDSSVVVTDTGLPADAKIECILNGGVVGGFTPISFLPTIPIDMIAGLNILNTDNVRFLRNSDTIPISVTGFVPDAFGLRLNLEDSADIFTLTYNSATVTHQWTNAVQTSPNLILNSTLTIQDSSTDPIANGIFSRNGNVLGLEIPEFTVRRTTTTDIDFVDLSLVKVDASPGSGDNIAALNYSVDDSGVIIKYAQTRAELRDATDAGRYYISVRADNNSSLVDAIEIIGDDNNLQSFINVNARISSDLLFGVESGVTDLKIFPQVNTIGITLDNASYTVGSAGTLGPPIVTSLGANKEAADAAFGNHDGNIGILDTGIGALTLFARQNDGNWAAVTMSRDVLI